MDEELEKMGYFEDGVTGFLEKKEKNSFSPMEKTKFLKSFKSIGDQSKIMEDLGYSIEILEFHLRKDLIFNRAFRRTLLEMRHDLEGRMYRAGLRGDVKQAKMWLEVQFPEVYKPSSVKKASKDKDTSVIDALYNKAVEHK